MQYLDEYRDKEIASGLTSAIYKLSKKKIRLMEFCGGHTSTILRYGIDSILPDTIELVSGPGCPVCVTSIRDIDMVIDISYEDDLITTSFGDIMRVPGTKSSLLEAKSNGADVRIVYSPLDAVEIAKANPDKKVVFFAIGFETTSPATASTILYTEKEGIENFFVLSSHKIVPPILIELLSHDLAIDGFICPGHVSTIIGIEPYRFVVDDYRRPCVITGFEPIDILHAIYMLVKEIEEEKAFVDIQYRRVVRPEGNRKAIALIDRIFSKSDAKWRGIGIIPASGLEIREEYKGYDAKRIFDTNGDISIETGSPCICGEILKGRKRPIDCPLFKTLCTQDNPVGACMVSEEGTCSVYYRFGR